MTAPATNNGRASVYENAHNEFVAVVLAATVGTRLFPLTDSSSIPKHLLEVAGLPILQRLLHQLESSGFVECVVAISHEDQHTIEFIKQEIKRQRAESTDKKTSWKQIIPSSLNTITAALGSAPGSANASSVPQPSSERPASHPSGPNPSQDLSSASICFHLNIADRLNVTFVRLGEDCQGSVDALNEIEVLGIIAPKAHVVVLPGDLVLLEGNNAQSQSVLMDLVHSHRHSQSSSIAAACTILLSDVGEQDENGVPLKESSKLKKGGFARDEDDIEYVALSYPNTAGTAPRVVWKQSKLEAEEDKDMTGATPKLVLPKPRLRLGGITKVRTDWTDVHVYVLSPWVRRLIVVRKGSDENQMEKTLSLISLADDLLPLLISRQFLSIQEAFGSKMDPTHVEELLKSLQSTSDFGLFTSPVSHFMGAEGVSSGTTPKSFDYSSGPVSVANTSADTKANRLFSVQAHIQKSAFRSATIAAYIYVNREMVSRALAIAPHGSPDLSSSDLLMLPPTSSIRHKFHSVILPESQIGEKVTFKSTVVGRKCTLGNKCRLNNVILLDSVTLGDNVSLQNTVVGRGVTIGDNCSLNDCQVAPGKVIPSGTKAKSEAFSDDAEYEG